MSVIKTIKPDTLCFYAALYFYVSVHAFLACSTVSRIYNRQVLTYQIRPGAEYVNDIIELINRKVYNYGYSLKVFEQDVYRTYFKTNWLYVEPAQNHLDEGISRLRILLILEIKTDPRYFQQPAMSLIPSFIRQSIWMSGEAEYKTEKSHAWLSLQKCKDIEKYFDGFGKELAADIKNAVWQDNAVEFPGQK